MIAAGLAFMIAGLLVLAWGWVGIPNPLWLAAGALLVAIGIGLLLRLQIARRAGITTSGATLAWGAYRLWRLGEDAGLLDRLIAGAAAGVGGLLLLALALGRWAEGRTPVRNPGRTASDRRD